MSDVLYQIHLSYATFGIVARGLKVIKAAPIAKWTIGKNLDYVLSYYQNKGAAIQKVDKA